MRFCPGVAQNIDGVYLWDGVYQGYKFHSVAHVLKFFENEPPPGTGVSRKSISDTLSAAGEGDEGGSMMATADVC